MNAQRVFKTFPDQSGMKLPAVSFGDGIMTYELDMLEAKIRHILHVWGLDQ